jgi:hypothetical protein
MENVRAQYFASLGVIEFAEMGIDLDGVERFEGSTLDLDWNNAAEEAWAQSRSIDFIIQFALDQLRDGAGKFLSDELANNVEIGGLAWQDLTQKCGLDVEGVFLRRLLIPFALIPRHIPEHCGKQKLSLFTHLQQAHDAFVFGAPFAALALMRSIAEKVLDEHYHATGQGLKALLKDARIPDHLRARLSRLKDLADSVLHFNPDRAQMPLDLQREIVSLLLALRVLIEDAPSEGSGR